MAAGLVLSVTGGAHAGGLQERCTRALPEGPAGLPAEVIVTTRCGRFGLEPNGPLLYKGPFRLPVPRGASYSPFNLTWWRFSGGHLLVGRGMRHLWRSRDRYSGTHPGNVGVVVLGRRRLAFDYYASFKKPPRLFLAGYRTRERPVARGETPLEFVGSGELVTWRVRGGALVLRAATGRFERLLARHAVDPQVDRQSGMLLYRDGDRLRVFDGQVVRDLASLGALGLDRRSTAVEALGRLVAIHDRNRLVVLDYEGLVVASTALPERRERGDGVSSPVVANAAGTAVAFTATLGNTAYGSHGHETVYLLAAGEQRARLLFDEVLDFNQCERMAWLAWHGQWLLYSNSEQRAAVVDSSANATPIELSGVVARLPGSQAEGFFDVAWAGTQ